MSQILFNHVIDFLEINNIKCVELLKYSGPSPASQSRSLSMIISGSNNHFLASKIVLWWYLVGPLPSTHTVTSSFLHHWLTLSQYFKNVFVYSILLFCHVLFTQKRDRCKIFMGDIIMYYWRNNINLYYWN